MKTSRRIEVYHALLHGVPEQEEEASRTSAATAVPLWKRVAAKAAADEPAVAATLVDSMLLDIRPHLAPITDVPLVHPVAHALPRALPV
jgi:hypothetical protein